MSTETPVVTAPEVVSELEKQSFQAMVSKGIYTMLFPMVNDGGTIKADVTTNVLNGYPVGGISSSGDSVDSEEFQDQLMGGESKTFVSGATDPGDVTLATYFNASKGKPRIAAIRHSKVFTPQFILIFATSTDEADKLQGWWAAGVNYLGGSEIKGDYGKIIGSSLKFKVTGMQKVGMSEVGLIDKALYGPLPYVSIEDVLEQTP